jgi:hypothetical protein
VLKEHELLITDWAPIHLSKMLQTWFWKDATTAVSALEIWQNTCCYLYLPRLREADTLRVTIARGVSSRDFFGIAYGCEDGRFQGFNFAQSTTPILDDALLLIDPKAASAFAAKLAKEAAEREVAAKTTGTGASSKITSANGASTVETGASVGSTGSTASGIDADSGVNTGANGEACTKKTLFFGSVELDPLKAKLQFSDVAEEVLMLFTQKPGVKVRISVEIEAESSIGFDDGIQRAVRENCDQLKFKNRTFDE